MTGKNGFVWSKALIAAPAALLILNACSPGANTGSSYSDTSGLVTESALAEANSEATATDSASNVGILSQEELASPLTSSACSYATARGTCSGNQDTITFSDCTLNGGKVTVSGGWHEVFGGATTNCAVPVVDGGNVTRSTTASGVTESFTISGNTVSVVTDTSGGTAYDGTVLASGGSAIANSGGTRTISLSGMHRAASISSVKLFDHLIKTTTPLSVTGTKASGRTIASGTVVLYHNLAKYQSTMNFNGVTWGDSTCCFPTSGTITGTVSGSISGTTTLLFSSNCGVASYTDTSGTTNSSYQLSQCN